MAYTVALSPISATNPTIIAKANRFIICSSLYVGTLADADLNVNQFFQSLNTLA